MLGIPSQFGTIPLSAFGQLGTAAAGMQSALLQQQMAQNAVRLQQALTAQPPPAPQPEVPSTETKPVISFADLGEETAAIEIVGCANERDQNFVPAEEQPMVNTANSHFSNDDPLPKGFANITRFECTYRLCRNWFGSMVELHTHIRTVHQGSCHVCNDCGKTFGSYMGLKFHSSKHTGLFRFNCPQCNKGFNRIEQFQSHMNMHDGQGFVCLRCKKVFLHKTKLMQHTRTCDASGSV